MSGLESIAPWLSLIVGLAAVAYGAYLIGTADVVRRSWRGRNHERKYRGYLIICSSLVFVLVLPILLTSGVDELMSFARKTWYLFTGWSVAVLYFGMRWTRALAEAAGEREG